MPRFRTGSPTVIVQAELLRGLHEKVRRFVAARRAEGHACNIPTVMEQLVRRFPADDEALWSDRPLVLAGDEPSGD